MFKIKSIVFVIYLSLLVISFFVVKNVIKDSVITARETHDKKVVKDKKPANVELKLATGNINQEFEITLDNQTSVLGMLEQLRLKNQLDFEITSYSYGVEIDVLNGKYSDSNNKWTLYNDNVDITRNIENEYLKNNAIYLLKYE